MARARQSRGIYETRLFKRTDRPVSGRVRYGCYSGKNEYALKSSLQQLKGAVRTAIEELRSRILYQTAFIESALDDPEHISLDGYPDRLSEEVHQRRKHFQS